LSPYLLSDAVASRALRGRVVLGDMRVLPFRDGAVGAVVNMFTSFGYFETDLDNVRVMHEAARVMTPGGVFLMDFLNADALAQELRDGKPTERRERDAVVEERREIVDDGRVLVKHVRVRVDAREPVEYHERLRLYRHHDLVAMAETSGLVARAVYGDYALTSYDARTSPRVIMVCAKPGGNA
ncbi:MAG TPA: class I SAM-dependent methyltransferase, partial [Candidatus Krumholzibacteria bacterium]|nr:class I SAM-dependent methyltransferase [Candidatus Krumholzibacteria bacterium]